MIVENSESIDLFLNCHTSAAISVINEILLSQLCKKRARALFLSYRSSYNHGRWRYKIYSSRH